MSKKHHHSSVAVFAARRRQALPRAEPRRRARLPVEFPSTVTFSPSYTLEERKRILAAFRRASKIPVIVLPYRPMEGRDE